MPQNMASPHALLSSPSPRFAAQPFIAGPACHAGERGIAEQGGADLLFIGPALDFEAVHLLLTASINHPETVPLWVRARRVSFAVAARQEDFPGRGRICFTFVACFWHLLLNQNPLDVVISKGFTAAACEVGEQGREAGTSEAGMFPSDPRSPVEITEMQGQVVRPVRWEGTGGSPKQATRAGAGLLDAKFTLLILGQKRFVCSVRVLASLKGEGPAGGSVPLGCLSGSFRILESLAVASLLQ